jgi:hypothetical protein
VSFVYISFFKLLSNFFQTSQYCLLCQAVRLQQNSFFVMLIAGGQVIYECYICDYNAAGLPIASALTGGGAFKWRFKCIDRCVLYRSYYCFL